MLKPFVNSYVHIPFLGAGIVFGLMLLFYKELDCAIQTIFVPAIAVYMIGSSFIGYLYFELDVMNCVRAAKNGEKPSPQPPYITWIFRFLHGFWFLLLMCYLFYKSVL
jgi:hypothetical protein